MTNLLLRLFVKNHENTEDPRVRAAVGKLSGILGIVCNVLLFAAKLVAGLLSGSMAVIADAMNNLSDASSAIITLLGFRLAEKPADEHHPYGHARYEYLSGLAVAGLIVVIGAELAISSFEKIVSPTPVQFSYLTVGILLGSLAVKLWLFLLNRKLGKLIGSATLEATATDSRNDCISTGAVLLTGILQHFTNWNVDGPVGLGVGVFILYSGAQLARQTISPLLGESASPELRECIVDYIRRQPRVLGYHDLMVHDYGPGQRFASVHVEMDHKLDPILCHDLIDDMERECLASHNVHLVIHYDPVVTDDPELLRLLALTQSLLREEDARMHIHDFRMVRGVGHTNLVFDVVTPPDLFSKKDDIQRRLQEELTRREGMNIYTVITFDLEAFN